MGFKEVLEELHLINTEEGYCFEGESFVYPDDWESITTPLIAPNLRSVTLPASVNLIFSGVFVNCPKLSEIIVPEDNKSFFAEDGILYMKDRTVANTWYANAKRDVDLILPEGVKMIGCRVFTKCPSVRSITLPSTLCEVWNNAFDDNDTLTRVLIRNSEEPEKKIRFAQWAFRSCTALRSIVVENGAPVELRDGVFRSCTSLEQAVLPSIAGVIPTYAFYECRSLKSFTVPEGVTGIEKNAFEGCRSLESLTLPDGLKSIGWTAFYRCESLADIVIPDSVTEIDESVFHHAGLVSAKLGRGVKRIPVKMFSECEKLQKVDIPEEIQIIDRSAFYECTSLASLTLPGGLRSIRAFAFFGCSSLTHITIPSGVTTIDKDAFKECGLKTITHRGKTYHINNEEDYESAMSEIIEKVNEVDRDTPKMKKKVWFWDYPEPYMDEFEYLGRDDDADEGFWNYKWVDEDYVLKPGKKESM